MAWPAQQKNLKKHKSEIFFLNEEKNKNGLFTFEFVFNMLDLCDDLLDDTSRFDWRKNNLRIFYSIH